MKALLTWKTSEGRIVEEIVEMVPPDSPIYGPGPDGHAVVLPFTSEDLLNDTERVFFEDANGIFGMDPHLIISVEPLGRNPYIAYDERTLLYKERVMEKIKKIAKRTKKFVSDHRVAIAIVGTTAVMLKVNKLALKDHEDFMDAHGILDLYYTPSEEEI